jgi:hypothetical protein
MDGVGGDCLIVEGANVYDMYEAIWSAQRRKPYAVRGGLQTASEKGCIHMAHRVHDPAYCCDGTCNNRLPLLEGT